MISDNLLTDNLELILTHLPVAVTVQDKTGVLVWANLHAARIIGFPTPAALLAAPITDIMERFHILNEKGQPMSLSDLPGRSVLQTHKPDEKIIRYKELATGDERWSLVKAQPVMKKEKFLGVINSFYDLTTFKSTERKLRFLTVATSSLSQSMGYEERLQKLADLIVPEFADWCALDMMDNDGNLKRLAFAHPHTKLGKEVREIAIRNPDSFGSRSSVLEAVTSGRSHTYSNIADAMLKKTITDEYQLKLLMKLKPRSVAIVPLTTRNRTLGAITLVRTWPHSPYSSADMTFFESLARKVALLVDNSRLHARLKKEAQKSREILRSLQENESALKLALEVGQMGIWDWKIRKGRPKTTPALARFASLPGLTGQISYDDFLKRIDPTDKAVWHKTVMNALTHTGPYEGEFRYILSDGTKRWIFGKGEVLPNAIGNPERIIGVGIDITRRKRMEETLRLSEKKFKTIFSTALDAMIIFDDTLKIRDANPAARTMFLLSHDRLLQKKIFHLTLTEFRQDLRQDVQLYIKNGSGRGEIETKLKTGIRRIIEYSITADVLPRRHLAVLRDVTDRKIEEKRSQHFLGIASHELKSPLASIKAMTQLLMTRLTAARGEKNYDYLQRIDEKVDAVTFLINDLLDVTRIRQGKIEFIYELFSIDELVKHVVDEIRVSEKSHQLLTDLTANKQIVADRLRISQVIRNILRNAIKYSPPNTTITISTKLTSPGVLIRIKDQGSGIPKADRTKVFDLYYRSNVNRDTVNKGLGVGLYISAQIVKQHGGKIWVDESTKKGATFCIYLPLKPKKPSKSLTLIT